MRIFSIEDLQDASKCIFWIRRSTGRLCVDLTPGYFSQPSFYHLQILTPESISSVRDPNPEARVINTLDVPQYHNLCSWYLRRPRYFSVSVEAAFNLGAIIAMCCPLCSQLDRSVEIASLTDVNAHFSDWHTKNDAAAVKELSGDGWTRYVLFVVSLTISH